MSEQQNIVITNVQRNGGCLSGCGTLFAVVLLIGLAVEYWYVSVAVAAIGAGVGYYLYARREPQPLTAAVASAVTSACRNCGTPHGAGAFCAHCGTPQGQMCSGCEKRGLLSDFCPDCGAATYTPVAPT